MRSLLRLRPGQQRHKSGENILGVIISEFAAGGPRWRRRGLNTRGGKLSGRDSRLILCRCLPDPIEILAAARFRFGEPALSLILVLWNAVAVEVQASDIHHCHAVAAVGSFRIRI